MIKFEPLNDRVLVKREDPEDKTPGGIILPQGAKEKPREGIVKVIGPGKERDNGTVKKMTVKVGDRILMPMFAGSEIKVDGEIYVLLLEDEILGILK